MPDILSLTPLADQNCRLADLKWFAKDPIKYVPGVGWGLLFLDCIFLKRDWTKDAGRIHKTFARILRHNSPFWLVSFSEGTRITPSKLQRSQDFSRRTGCPVLEHVLFPRTRGFVACVSQLRNRTDAIYDVTLGYEPGVPTLWQFFKRRNQRVHLHVRRFPMTALPTSQKELAQWLIDRFIEKDQRMKQFQDVQKFYR
jgi:1-acyl-sn-glycerol-3-phosphate acyltransferase